MKVIKLDPNPSRELTDRECCSLLGGIIGAMVRTSGVETVRRAVTWWASTDAAWHGLRQALTHEPARSVPPDE